jgi:Transposase DDE domain
MSRPKPPTYRTTNWHDYNAALTRRGSLAIWFDPETQWLAAPTGKRGRQPVFTDAAIQTCLTLKALFGLPLRQTTGMVASLLDLAGLDWPVPDFSTLCRRQKTLMVHIPYRPSSGALHLLIDSTGVKAKGDGEWLARKHGPSKPRDWRKVHLGIDAESLEIRAIEITGSRVGDAPMLPDLLDQIPGDQSIGIVTADGAYDTRACHAAIAERGAAAVIPPRRNGKPWKEHTAGATVRNEALRSCRRLGRAIWKRWTGYHRRSLVEAKMRCLKLLGERVMSRDFDRQVAELQIRAAILNRFTALGTPLTQRAG